MLCATLVQAQTLGGQAAYTFLKLPSSPVLSAAGGALVSYTVTDVSYAITNPALLSPQMNTQLGFSWMHLPVDINSFSMAGALHHQRSETTFGGSIYFMDYGTIQQTDAAGNVAGSFHANDYAVQFLAAKKYLDKWHYGMSAKLVHSGYQQYSSTAIAVDVGVLYQDSAKGFSAAILSKNMGAQVKNYNDNRQDLPFDLQVGITKKLSKAPFAFSVTAYQLHRFNLLHNDTLFDASSTKSGKALQRVFDHLDIATHIYAGNNLEAIIGYNALRRRELTTSVGNGLTGFSAGVFARFKTFQVAVSRSVYQRGLSYTQLGINLWLNALTGLGTL